MDAPKTVDAYLAPLDDEMRAALESLRATIKAVVPRAQECIVDGMPAYRIGGTFFVGFGAIANRCSFYAGAHPVGALARELKPYKTSKGSISFEPARPLPDALVRKVLKARFEDFLPRNGIAPKAPARTGKRKA